MKRQTSLDAVRVELAESFLGSGLTHRVGVLLPGLVLGGRGRDVQVAGLVEPGVDSLSFAELADLVDRLL